MNKKIFIKSYVFGYLRQVPLGSLFIESLKSLLPQRKTQMIANDVKSDGSDFILKVENDEHNIFIRKGTSDFEVFKQIYLDQEYNFRLDVNPKTIVDLGANIGLASRYFHQQFPEARIIGLEPERNNFMASEKNTQDIENIQMLNFAISDEDGEVWLQDNNSGSWGFSTSVSEPENLNNSYKVPSICLDSLMSQNDIDFIDILKIDIEGVEKVVFGPDNIEWLKKVKYLIIELHDHLVPGCSYQLHKHLSKLNYEQQIIGENNIFKINN